MLVTNFFVIMITMKQYDLTTYSGRLLFAIDNRQTNQSELARAVGVEPQAIQYLCKKGTKSGHSVKIAKILSISSIWLTSGAGEWDLLKDKQINEENALYNQIKGLIRIPQVKWKNLTNFLSSTNEPKELEIMPTNKIEVSQSAFMIEMDHDHPSSQFKQGDLIIIDPEKTIKTGDKVIASLNSEYHIMSYEKLGHNEYLHSISSNSSLVFEPTHDHKIIGVLAWVVPAGRKP